MSAPPLKSEISAPYPVPSNATMRIGIGKLWDYVTGLLGVTGNASDARVALGVDMQHGQCRLSKSGANLVLSPYNGNKLIIGGVQQTIPAAGVLLAPTSLVVGTTYYIYARMNGATMMLEPSTTTHATDSGLGVEIKSGDSTRTLVGIARPITGPAWQDSSAQRFVRSWFNRTNSVVSGSFTVTRSTTSTTPAEVNSEIRNEFLLWAGESVSSKASGSATNSAVAVVLCGIAFDGTTAENGVIRADITTAGAYCQVTPVVNKSGLSEGYHYATIIGFVNSGTASWEAGTANGRNYALTSKIGD